MDCWRRLPNKSFFFVLLASWGLLFQFWGNSILGYIHTSSLFAWLYDAYTVGGEQNDSSYGTLIPFLVAGKEAIELGTVGDLVDTNVQNGGAGLYGLGVVFEGGTGQDAFGLVADVEEDLVRGERNDDALELTLAGPLS